jgi:hypothetical protein
MWAAAYVHHSLTSGSFAKKWCRRQDPRISDSLDAKESARLIELENGNSGNIQLDEPERSDGLVMLAKIVRHANGVAAATFPDRHERRQFVEQALPIFGGERSLWRRRTPALAYRLVAKQRFQIVVCRSIEFGER